MSVDGILLTHAEVAGAITGFAGVAAVMRRPLTPLQRHRFWAMLLGALVQIMGCLVPVWMMGMDIAGPAAWRYASFAFMAMNLTISILLYIPLWQMGVHSLIIVNLPITYVIYLVIFLMWVPLIANAFFVAVPGFGLYYAALMAGMVGVFVTFADVVVTDRDPV